MFFTEKQSARKNMRYVRIRADAFQNPEWYSIWVDAVLDENDRIVGRQTLFGLHGSFERKEEAFWPFALDEKGYMDYGRGYDKEPDDRRASLNLRDAPVVIGRNLIWQAENYGDMPFRIQQILDLSANI